MLIRIVSGLVMAVAVILGIFHLPAEVFNVFALLLMLGGLYEWSRLCQASLAHFIAAALLLILLYALYSTGLLNSLVLFVLLCAGVLLWLYKTFMLASPATSGGPGCLLDGTATLGLAWLAMVVLRDQFGEHSLMLVLLMVWSADSFAYFGGKRFGRTKLAPSISPGKTREGVVSGMLMAMLVAVLYSHLVLHSLTSFMNMFLLLFVSMLVALISVVGDLSESKLKRAAGVKDSSHIIPGHGGILDRIDGLVAGLVIFAFYSSLQQVLLNS